MAGRNSTAAMIDGSAIVLSSLCLIHCLALPIMSAALPVAGVWAEAEWVHRLFVLLAVPFALLALASKHVGYLTGSLIVFGISILAAGAFVEALHDYEVALTVAGASLLAAGHGLRWLNTYNAPH
jgi:ethanolamine transporter EutH